MKRAQVSNVVALGIAIALMVAVVAIVTRL